MPVAAQIFILFMTENGNIKHLAVFQCPPHHLGIEDGMLAGDIGFSDGILPVAVSAIFLGLLSFIWITEQRAVAKAKLEVEDAAYASNDEYSTGDEGLDPSR